ncbi:hypothetical protein JXM83_03525 [Candidatus Woesearchaeota archaeon]|nr:hypothetical protein [Candidatus Woesearchaeota archaeon]
MGDIETGVDKLVNLVRKRGKISLKKASKELGVSKPVVLEWAEMLDEENLVNIEYGLVDSTISLKTLSNKDVVGKKREFLNQKDAFVRKIDTALATLDTENDGLKKLHEEFHTIKKEISDDLDKVKTKISKLENYHKLKHEIDKEMVSQQSQFENFLNDTNNRIEDERSKYSLIIKQINQKESEIDKEKQETDSLLELQTSLQKKLDAIIKTVNESSDKIVSENKRLEINRNELLGLKKQAESIKKHILKKRDSVESTIQKSKTKEGKISDLQNNIKSTISTKTKDIKNSESINKLNSLFDKKNSIQEKLTLIEKEHNDLENELKILKKKAIGFKIASGSKSESNISSIEKEFNRLTKKKSKYQEDLKELFQIIK